MCHVLTLLIGPILVSSLRDRNSDTRRRGTAASSFVLNDVLWFLQLLLYIYYAMQLFCCNRESTPNPSITKKPDKREM